MKKLLLLIITTFILTGCSSAKLDERIEIGLEKVIESSKSKVVNSVDNGNTTLGKTINVLKVEYMEIDNEKQPLKINGKYDNSWLENYIDMIGSVVYFEYGEYLDSIEQYSLNLKNEEYIDYVIKYELETESGIKYDPHVYFSEGKPQFISYYYQLGNINGGFSFKEMNLLYPVGSEPKSLSNSQIKQLNKTFEK